MPKYLLKPKNNSESIWKEYKTSPLTIEASNPQEARKEASKRNLDLKLSESEKKRVAERSPWLNESLTECKEN